VVTWQVIVVGKSWICELFLDYVIFNFIVGRLLTALQLILIKIISILSLCVWWIYHVCKTCKNKRLDKDLQVPVQSKF
jgi:hypothetical protein